MRRLERSVPALDLWFWEATLLRIEHVEGRRMSLAEKVEALLAEGWNRLRDLGAPVHDLPGGDMERLERIRAWRAEVAGWKAEAEEGCEERLRELAAPAVEGPPGQEALPVGAEALDACVSELARALHERDLRLGELALRFFGADGWRRLGFASDTQYARDRAGMSFSSLKGRMTLWRRSVGLKEVREAALRGEVGYAAAHLVARVARPESSAAWVERARERTFKHLREEVEAMELLARVQEEAFLRLGPPDEEELEEVFKLERAVRSGALLRGPDTEGEPNVRDEPTVRGTPTGVRPGAGATRAAARAPHGPRRPLYGPRGAVRTAPVPRGGLREVSSVWSSGGCGVPGCSAPVASSWPSSTHCRTR